MELTRETILEKLRENHAQLSSEYGLRRIGIFGSYARGMQQSSSDLDIIAEFEAPIGLRFIEFSEYLEGILGRKTGVLTPAGLEAIRNQKIAQEIRETITYA